MSDVAPLSLEERLALCRVEVTLDGEPATICGALRPFATVVTLPDGPRLEWDWETAHKVAAAGGDFRSRGQS